MWLLLWSLLVQVLTIRAAYYHELSMATFQPPAALQNDSFFGYSIAFYNKGLTVSAPRADRDGQLFSCALDTKLCTKMHSTMPDSRVDDHTRVSVNHHFWLGATVKADKNKLFVCAPRCTDNLKFDPGGTFFSTSGACYFTSTDRSDFITLPRIDTKERSQGRTANENMTDTFGWSMDIDGKILRVGSPALAAGRVMTYTDTGGAAVPKLKIKPRNKHGFNFGYSIANGRFLTRTGSNDVAVGTPYGDYGVGKVIIYDYQSHFKHEISDPSKKVGSIFAASLCAAKLKSSTMSLLVGAPAHFTGDGYHTGMVYVYRFVNRAMTVVKALEGPNKNGAFFGYAIANVGDMDHDEMDEIVIAAPYEDDGRGAVYLYAGSSLELKEKNTKWLQRFQPESPKFWNLGLSLTANKYSDHGCNDLAIGAPGNDRVAMFNCLTVITVKLTATFPSLQETRRDKTKFEFKSCLTATYPTKPANIQAKLRVRVKITHPNATLTNANPSTDYVEYDEILKSDQKDSVCREIHVTTSENGDYDQEIQFDLTATQLVDPESSKDFDASRATMSHQSSLTFSDSVRVAECKEEPCKPKLTVGIKSHIKYPYTIGSSETETLTVVVRNGDGDTAYRPCMRVSVEGDVTITRALHCSFVSEQQRICQLQKPLKPDSNWETKDIELGLTSLTSNSKAMKIVAEVFNRCETNNPAEDMQIIDITFKTDSSGVRIDSKTDQGEIVTFNRDAVRNGKILYHTYTITNTAGTNWVNLECDIGLQMQPYLTFNNSIQIYSDDTPRDPCDLSKLSKTGGRLKAVSCQIGDVFRKDTITIVITMATVPGALEDILKTSNATAETILRVKFTKSQPREKKEITLLTFQEATVPLWVILVATIVGILLFLLIAFALYECGFLRRQNKEKLQALKKEVKRKSMMLQRQSMRLSDSARAELRNRTYRELLDEAEIKEADELGTEAKEVGTEVKKEKTAIEGKPEVARKPATVLNSNSSISNLDLRAQIEKSLQKPNPKGFKQDKKPLCNENEI